jgi:hypothetical protein
MLKQIARSIVIGQALLLAPLVIAQPGARDTIQITVPRRVAAGQLPITRVQIRLQLTTTGPVAFKITNGNGQELRFPSAAGTSIPVGGTNDNTAAPYTFQPAGAISGDTVSIVGPSASLDPSDPGRGVWTLNIDTLSDFNFSNCADLKTANETWTIKTINPATEALTAQMAGFCVISWDKKTPGFECQTDHLIDPADTPLASVVGAPANSVQVCAASRAAVDAVLVLDKSGSMSSTVDGTAGAPIKINALHDAVTDFVTVWEQLRASEGTPPGDRIGLVFFDDVAKWAHDFGGGWSPLTKLDLFSSASGTIKGNINSIPAGGSTNLGGGMELAAAEMTGGNRKVILAMSNGQQNTGKKVDFDSAVNPTKINTYPYGSPGSAAPLPNQSNFSGGAWTNGFHTYSVTVGVTPDDAKKVNQNMAIATGGFYADVLAEPDKLRPFFLEMLQNFVHFNTYETVKLVSGSAGSGGPFTTNFALTSSTRFAAVILQWQVTSQSEIQLVVTPPGGAAISVSGRSGFLVAPINLPLKGNIDFKGDWQAAVTQLFPRTASTPVNVTVIADDLGTKSEMTATGANLIPGQPVRLRVRLSSFGRKLVNIGGAAGGQAVAQLVRPGVTIGDLLSTNNASATPPANGDAMTPANAKLFNLLQQNPGVLQHVSSNITLTDNGNAANGDDTANDGIYSAVFTPPEPGTYTFLFGAEGNTPTASKFTRMQIMTVHVRPIPDVNQTQIQATTQANVMTINYTPKTLSGSRFGPGWATYFWFTAPGVQPFKGVDNLDGTYRATLNFTGSAPVVSLHFIDTPSIILESEPAAGLPINSGNVIIPDVTKAKKRGCFGGSGMILIPFTAAIVLIGLVVYRPRRREED